MPAGPPRVGTRALVLGIVLSLLATAAVSVLAIQKAAGASALQSEADALHLARATFALDLQATVLNNQLVGTDFGVGLEPSAQAVDQARMALVHAIDATEGLPVEVLDARAALDSMGPAPTDRAQDRYYDRLYDQAVIPLQDYLQRVLEETWFVVAANGMLDLASVGPEVFARVAMADGREVTNPAALNYINRLTTADPVPAVPGADDLSALVGVPGVGSTIGPQLTILAEGPAASQVREGLRWIVAAAAAPDDPPAVPSTLDLPTFLQQLVQLELAIGQVVQDQLVVVADLTAADAAHARTTTRTVLAAAVVCLLPGLVLTRVLLVRVRARQRELERSASRDPLTGLLNRTGLEKHPAVTRAGAGRRSGDNGQIVLVADLDHFKPINDAHGHHTGDAVLQEFARVLSSAVRGDDAIARWGGDEFVLVVSARADAASDAGAVGERITAGLQQPFDVGGTRLVLSASLGAAWCRCGGCGFDTLMRVADTAVYDVKRRGRGGLEVLPCPQEPPHTRLQAKAMRASRRF